MQTRLEDSFTLPASARSRQSYYNAAFCVLQSIRTLARLSSSARTYSPEAPRAESVINQAAASIQDTHTPLWSAEKAPSFSSEHLRQAGSRADPGCGIAS